MGHSGLGRGYVSLLDISSVMSTYLALCRGVITDKIGFDILKDNQPGD